MGAEVARKTLKPEATLKLTINGKAFAGERWGGRWVLHCPAYPDIVERYGGGADASPALDEFTRRAAGATEDNRP